MALYLETFIYGGFFITLAYKQCNHLLAFTSLHKYYTLMFSRSKRLVGVLDVFGIHLNFEIAGFMLGLGSF